MSLATALALGFALTAAAESDSVISKEKYSVATTKTTRKVKAGKQGLFSLHIKPAEGFKVSREAPLKLQLSADGLTLAKTKLGKKDVKGEKTEALFEVEFATAASGDKSIDATAVFFVCNENLCERKSEKLKVSVKVEP